MLGIVKVEIRATDIVRSNVHTAVISQHARTKVHTSLVVYDQQVTLADIDFTHSACVRLRLLFVIPLLFRLS
jgi:hypothetical protein